jgi:hypothetical protein
MSNSGYTKKTTLAKPWILPLVIITGLAAAWAAPWTFADGTPVSYIGKTLVPLLAQAIISSLCSIFAFLGKPAWLPMLFVTLGVSFLNAFGFLLGLWGVAFQLTQSVVLLLVAIALVPTAIWGRKVVDYAVTTDVPTFNSDPRHDNW